MANSFLSPSSSSSLPHPFLLLFPYVTALLLFTTLPSVATSTPAISHYDYYYHSSLHTTVTQTASSPSPKRSDFPRHINFFAAAACCARGPACWDRHARNSVFCIRNRWMSSQSLACQRAACFFCMRRNPAGVQFNKQKPVCRALALLKNCFGAKPPYPRPPKNYMPPSPSPSPAVGKVDSTVTMPPQQEEEDTEPELLEVEPRKPADGDDDEEPQTIKRNPPSQSPRPRPVKKPYHWKQKKKGKKQPRSQPHAVQTSGDNSPSSSSGSHCVTYAGANGRVVIPTSGMPARGKWMRTHHGKGITWKPHGGAGIDRPEAGDPFCVQFVPDSSAMYYFTVLSSAPHPTEHNDAWFRFPYGKGFCRYRPQSKSVMGPSRKWIKGYQNDGANHVANYILNEDFDGHQLITPYLVRGNKYEVCVAGRSSKFTLYKMVLVACPPETADEWPKHAASCSRFGKPVATAMGNLVSSQCLLRV